jgi:5-methylcytosine-specific restriction protein A
MDLYYHNVGLAGADRDFPKTVFGRVELATIESHAPGHLREEMSSALRQLYPDGTCNCWGVPEGARPVIRRLATGDAVLLIRTIAGDGEIPALAPVDAFWREPMPALSRALWGSERFPYVFFFNTARITLSWIDFRDAVQYLPNYRPPGVFLRVTDADEKLAGFGGLRGYLNRLTGSSRYPLADPPKRRLSEATPEDEYNEGQRLTRERAYFRRNPRLVADAKVTHGTRCQACGFQFAERYGDLGDRYIECHHLNPLSDREDGEFDAPTTIADVAVVCSNCHRMIHRKRPPIPIEELRRIIRAAADGTRVS